jgi:outer membrane protein OmpA-like peptidoglycan-associated protein
MSWNRSRGALIVCAVVVAAVSGFAGCGKDLSPLKAKALGLVDTYRPQLESGLKTVGGLLDQAKTLPADTPVVGDLVKKLGDQKGNLEKLQGLLAEIPGKVESATKEGKEEELTKLVGTLETDVGGGIAAATTAATESGKVIEATKTELVGKTQKDGTAKIAELGGALNAAIAKLDAQIATWKGMPADAPGVADALKGAEALKATADAAATTLAGAPARIDESAKANDPAALGALVATLTGEIEGATKKIETELEALKTAQAGAVPADFAKALSTGFEVKGKPEGIEAQLIAFIEDAAKVVDDKTWFNFDRLNFASGATELDMEASKDQLANIAEIMKAFPNVSLKIGGYTDADGNAGANRKLSQKRAEAVMAAVVALGIDKGRLAAEGYGPEHPVCPANDTDECKAQNRRIAVRVTAK